MYGDVSLFIDGSWTAAAGGRTLTVLNPASSEPLGKVAHAEKADLDRALEAGINSLDTANIYSEGQSEERLGEWLGEWLQWPANEGRPGCLMGGFMPCGRGDPDGAQHDEPHW